MSSHIDVLLKPAENQNVLKIYLTGVIDDIHLDIEIPHHDNSTVSNHSAPFEFLKKQIIGSTRLIVVVVVVVVVVVRVRVVVVRVVVVVVIIIIIWFGETVSGSRFTKCNTNSKVRALS